MTGSEWVLADAGSTPDITLRRCIALPEQLKLSARSATPQDEA